MNDSIQQLVKSVLQKKSLAECTVSELQQLAERYPYFSAGQLLLAQKLKDEFPKKYQSQLEKASLYFSNPLWMDYIINQSNYGHSEDDVKTETVIEKSIPPAETIEEHPAQTENIENTEPFDQVEIPVQETELVPEQEILHVNTIEESFANAEPAIQESIDVVEKAEEPLVSTEPNEEEELAEFEDETGPVLHLPQFKIEAIPSAKDDLLFEPYHTVDYFASVGIKTDTAEKPSDRFGKQLRSFTEWLKTMKKLPEAEVPSTVDSKQEEKVVNLAEHSIEDRDVVTETMAEVWEKQGNTSRAIEVYHKLSLLNPAKSTYFAAKIEHLKKV
jgi:hypothetical protein